MIKGMTGFGYAEFSVGQIRGTIEIKSVNHRYLDISYYLPPGYASVEQKIRELLSKHLERGRITVVIKLMSRRRHEVFFNKDVVKDYLKQAKILKNLYGIRGDLNLADIIQMPGVVDTKETLLSSEEMWNAIEKDISKALVSLLRMREREGKTLSKEIQSLLKRMLLQTKKIEARTKKIINEKKKLLPNDEFASFQKSSDIQEEITRLNHHTGEFRLLLSTDEAVGKKLDFIAQEMQRETNTMGSKLPDNIVSHAVITLKSKIEKIREQSQNIE